MTIRLSYLRESLLIRSLAVLVFFALASVSLTYHLNLHLHVLADGSIVVHSHPLDNPERGRSGHRHTDHEYLVLSGMGKILVADDPEPVQTPAYFAPCTLNDIFPDNVSVAPSGPASPNKRSPPVVTSA